ncbi:hypothetical protein [Burkholderia pseudomallei]|uniref:hypothetical protein n=1 Tax=Burkholderia pseudomallei TaxID=28450 RepID=UPI0015C36D12|nr:hypothetical protein [Burkholderia pseudomallei]
MGFSESPTPLSTRRALSGAAYARIIRCAPFIEFPGRIDPFRPRTAAETAFAWPPNRSKSIRLDPSAYGPGAARDRPCDTLVAERGARTFAAPRRHRRAAAPMPARPPPASVFQRARRPHIIRASRIRRATGARRLRRMDRRARPRGAAHRNPR